MLLKLIVLILLIVVILASFGFVNRQKIKKNGDNIVNKQTCPEEMISCEICETFVPLKTQNCGRAGCPY